MMFCPVVIGWVSDRWVPGLLCFLILEVVFVRRGTASMFGPAVKVYLAHRTGCESMKL